MRLKFLFFPSMLAIAISIIIGFVYPDYLVLQTTKEENIKKIATKKEDAEKLTNVKSLVADLSKNSQNKNSITSYLPETRIEERMVDTLNYLATGAGVLILDITVEKEAVSALPVLPAVDPTLVVPIFDAFGQPIVTEIPEPIRDVKFRITRVSIIGEYEKIKTYLGSLQRSDLYNVISSIKIGEKPAEVASPDTAKKPAGGPLLLVADIGVDFGYFSKVEDASSKTVSLKESTFNYATVDELQKFISKLPAIDPGSVGRANPFLVQ